MRSKKDIRQPNVIIGYDDKGEVSMYYWQEEPIKQRKAPFYTIPKWYWYNPIWRIRQWWFFRKPITFRGFEHITKSL